VIDHAEHEDSNEPSEHHRRGQPVSVDELLDPEDFDLLREERAAERDLAEGIAEAWT